MAPRIKIHYPTATDLDRREAWDTILTQDVLQFLTLLHERFEPTRQRLLTAREEAQKRFDADDASLNFLSPAEKADLPGIGSSWQCAPPAPGLVDRRVEITGPTDRKTVINALNSGAKTFMADFEDSNSPTFANILNGQVNLHDAVTRKIKLEINEKKYQLVNKPAVLIVRPRGWHLDEPRITVDNTPMSASLFDFGTFFYHNAHELVKRGHGPYFYLPKIEHYREARLWNDVFKFSQSYIKMPLNTIRATVLIETLPAAFQMEEILYVLKDHSSGLNCGRWDYIFSFIKKRRAHCNAVLPDRKDVTMTVPFMDAYVKLLIQTCHRRKVAAMGGMSAQIPIKDKDEENEVAMAKVRADKLREVTAGHDGTWIAHPLINRIAQQVFDEHMSGPNQYHVLQEKVRVTAADLRNPEVPGKITLAGVKENIICSLAYMSAWMGGNGCIALNHLMEDAATAEITRVQLWQWVHHGACLDSGELVTAAFIDKQVDELVPSIKDIVPGVQDKHITIASNYLKGQMRKPWPSEFLTIDLMPHLAAADGVDVWLHSVL